MNSGSGDMAGVSPSPSVSVSSGGYWTAGDSSAGDYAASFSRPTSTISLRLW